MNLPKPRLIMIMGLPGSGKTYFAKALSSEIGAEHFNSDRIRKELTAKPQYSSEDKATVYEKMLDDVCKALSGGETVVVDATFSRVAYRSAYLQYTAENDIPVHVIYVKADESVIKVRVSKKRPDSDADFEVYKKVKAEYEPIEGEYFELGSDKDTIEIMTHKALKYMSIKAVIR